MADKDAVFQLDAEDIGLSSIILIQAVIRGALVRKWMREVKQTYEKEFTELEKSNFWQVEWSSEFPCKPKIVRKSSKKTENGNDKQKNSKRSCANDLKSSKVLPETDTNVRGTDGKVLSDIIPNKCRQDVQVTTPDSLNIVDKPVNVAEGRLCHSVEIQTSFIDFSSQRDTDKKDLVRSDGLDNDVKLNQEDNILDDLDVSWKDRVEPFIKNNFANSGNHVVTDSSGEVDLLVDNKAETVKPDVDELHLDLDLGGESNDTHRSQVSTQRSLKKSAIEEESKQSGVNSYLKGTERNVTTDRSQNSETSSLSKNLDDLEKTSSRSSERDSRPNLVKTTAEDDGLSYDQNDKVTLRKQSQRSDRSGERGQRSNRSEQGSPRSHKSQYLDSKMSENQGQRTKFDEVPTSARSDRSGDDIKRSQSSERSRTHRSESSEGRTTQRSDRSERSVHSEGQRSRSAHSEGHLSDRSHGSRHSEGQRSGRKDQPEKMNPPQSRASPVALESVRQGRAPLQDSTSLTNVTSIWDSFNSVRDSHEVNMLNTLPQDADKLRELRKNISMELLWVQQAIDSRKNYLRLKGKM